MGVGSGQRDGGCVDVLGTKRDVVYGGVVHGRRYRCVLRLHLRRDGRGQCVVAVPSDADVSIATCAAATQNQHTCESTSFDADVGTLCCEIDSASDVSTSRDACRALIEDGLEELPRRRGNVSPRRRGNVAPRRRGNVGPEERLVLFVCLSFGSLPVRLINLLF